MSFRPGVLPENAVRRCSVFPLVASSLPRLGDGPDGPAPGGHAAAAHVFVTSSKAIRRRTVLGTEFRFVRCKPADLFGIVEHWATKTERVRVSDLERAIIDRLEQPASPQRSARAALVFRGSVNVARPPIGAGPMLRGGGGRRTPALALALAVTARARHVPVPRESRGCVTQRRL